MSHNVAQLKAEFESLCRTYIKREGIEQLLERLSKSDFYTAPASTRYHDSEEGGLVYHCIKVFKNLKHDLFGRYPDETLAIVALFHDLCKIGFYKVSSRNVKNEVTGKWEKVPYYEVDDKLPFGHGEKSVFLLLEFLKLDIQESMAIRWHMGAFVGQQDWLTLGTAFEQYPLAMYLHFADMKATYIKEEI